MFRLKNKRHQQLTWCVFFALFSGVSNTFAAGIDCGHTSTSSESMICGDAKLLKLDTQLAEVYSKLAKAKNSNKTKLQKTQKEWLLVRDKCADESCMINAYSDRVGKLNIEFHRLMAYKVDKTDMLALDELQRSVEKNMRSDAEFPLETALKAFEIKTGLTDFSNTSDDNDKSMHDAHFPTKRPKGVSQDEWAALVKSEIDGGGENGHASYTLLDIDGDGKRDLIIDSYIGGTGLFDYISATPRKGDVFAGHYVSQLADDAFNNPEEDGSLYSLNGRGANQSATWVRLSGRVYVAYRNSYYGVDNVFLLRPFYINESVPKLTLHYQYTFSIPIKQSNYNESTSKSTDYTLDKKTHAALVKAIQQVDGSKSHDGISNKPICPIPNNIPEDEQGGYLSYGPGHYSYEIVGDMPIWLNNTCYMGRLVDWFGSYAKEGGLHTMLWMALPNAEKEEASYDVDAKRKAVKIESGIGGVDFGGS